MKKGEREFCRSILVAEASRAGAASKRCRTVTALITHQAVENYQKG